MRIWVIESRPPFGAWTPVPEHNYDSETTALAAIPPALADKYGETVRIAQYRRVEYGEKR